MLGLTFHFVVGWTYNNWINKIEKSEVLFFNAEGIGETNANFADYSDSLILEERQIIKRKPFLIKVLYITNSITFFRYNSTSIYIDGAPATEFANNGGVLAENAKESLISLIQATRRGR